MPLHRFFVPKGLYTATDKTALSQAITEIYTRLGLPAFYVTVLFIELEPDNIFVGGKTKDTMVRVGIEHIALNFPDEANKRRFMDRYEKAIAPFTRTRGIDWEVQVSDCDRSLWHMNGMAPPLPGTELERLWRWEDRAVLPEEMPAPRASARL
ncbi:putative oxalocrotonate tautomerase [Mycena polygramma]|nr:putative oxalocrotonate tautomerase [Mycena polygramma]